MGAGAAEGASAGSRRSGRSGGGAGSGWWRWGVEAMGNRGVEGTRGEGVAQSWGIRRGKLVRWITGTEIGRRRFYCVNLRSFHSAKVLIMRNLIKEYKLYLIREGKGFNWRVNRCFRRM